MKRIIVAVFAVSALGVSSSFAQGNMAAPGAAPAAAKAVQGPIMTTLKTQWQGVRDKVVNISDIVPEDKYDFRATPDVRSFRELFQHVSTESVNFLGSIADLEGIARPNAQAVNAMTTKADLMKAMKDMYDWEAKVIDGLSEAQATEMVPGRGGMAPRWNAIVSLMVDNMDHYGNLVTYVRLNGMVPPTTAARPARGGGGGGRGGAGGAPGAAPAGGMPAAAAPRGN